ELGGLSPPPPGLVGLIPGDGLPHTLGKRNLWLPSKRLRPLHVERVAIIVARAIVDKMLQRRRATAQLEHGIGDLDAGDFAAGSKVVHGPWFAVLQHPRDPGDMV